MKIGQVSESKQKSERFFSNGPKLLLFSNGWCGPDISPVTNISMFQQPVQKNTKSQIARSLWTVMFPISVDQTSLSPFTNESGFVAAVLFTHSGVELEASAQTVALLHVISLLTMLLLYLSHSSVK